MSDQSYVLISELGAGGPDGTRWLGLVEGEPVEVQLLSFGSGTQRWERLQSRVNSIGSIRHRSVRRILGVERDPPAVIVEHVHNARYLGELIEGDLCLSDGIKVVAQLAAAIHVAHAQGIVHGQLHPWNVFLTNDDVPRVEFTSLETRSVEPHVWIDRCKPPERGTPTRAGDVFGLGALAEILATSAGRQMPEELETVVRTATSQDSCARPNADHLSATLATLSFRPNLFEESLPRLVEALACSEHRRTVLAGALRDLFRHVDARLKALAIEELDEETLREAHGWVRRTLSPLGYAESVGQHYRRISTPALVENISRKLATASKSGPNGHRDSEVIQAVARENMFRINDALVDRVVDSLRRDGPRRATCVLVGMMTGRSARDVADQVRRADGDLISTPPLPRRATNRRRTRRVRAK